MGLGTPKSHMGLALPRPSADLTIICWSPSRAQRLRDLSVQAYWAAENPTEAKMASILLTMFAPDVERAIHGVEQSSAVQATSQGAH